MADIYSASFHPSTIPDIHSQSSSSQDGDTMSAPRRSIIPQDFHDLSPLDALAAQGRLLNKRLTQHSRKSSHESTRTTSSEKSIFPKFGVNDTLEDPVFYANSRRHRIPGKRKEQERESTNVNDDEGLRSPTNSLSLAALSLLAIPQDPAPESSTISRVETHETNPFPQLPNLSRSISQASSQSSFSTSSDRSSTPTETYLTTRIYQPPPKLDPPKLRPIIKTQNINRPQSPVHSPTSAKDQMTPVSVPPVPGPFSPLANSLDRPRLPSLQTRGEQNYQGRRTPSINFSRPYSSRSSAFSDASSLHEVDYFSQRKESPPSDDHLPVPNRSPGSESQASSPGLAPEDLDKLPRGRRKSKHVIDTGVFFHSTNMTTPNSAHRWPQTPVTPTNNSERKFFPSPEQESSLPKTNRSLSTRSRSASTSKTTEVLSPPRPSTSGIILESPRNREAKSHEVRRPLTATRPRSQGSGKPRYTLQPPGSHEIFNSPTQILNPSRNVAMSLTPIPGESISPEDHVTIGINYHQQDQLSQSTHHFQLAAQGGSPTGMLFYSLSLRHGWGCAANPEKAVQWLHSAAECASAQVDENGVRRPAGEGNGALTFKTEDGKSGGATLALALYELGQSYIHGWGVQKDKYLALRCYELSANFGDTDGQWYIPKDEKKRLIVVKLLGVIYMELERRRMQRWLQDIIEWQRNRALKVLD